MLHFEKFVFNPFYENTYVVWDKNSKEGMIVDPGCYSEEEEIELKNYITKNEILLKYLVLTHCHLDHIFGCNFIKKEFNSKFIIPENDKFLLDNVKDQTDLFQISGISIPPKDTFLTEDSDLTIGNSKPKIIFTPGHSPGEYSLYFEKEETCLCGDVLFNGSIGRTDLWGGDLETLMNSIKQKLLTLPDKVKILPGHGENSTIGEERKSNPFLA